MDDKNNIWWPERRNELLMKVVAFLISPVLGLLTSLFRPNTKSSYFLIFLSFITIGLTMNVPDERTDEMNFDSTTYRHAFENYTEYSPADISSLLRDYREMTDDIATDLYAGFIYYTVSRFSDNYHVCFMVIAAIMAIFMLKSVKYLVSDSNYRFSIICLLLLFLFTLCQIVTINMFRFYTAYWMALYAIFKIILDNDKRYWALLVCTPFVHASYMVLFGVFVLYYILRDRQNLAVLVLLGAIIFSSISVQAFSWILRHIPGTLGAHYGSYLNEWYMAEINESGEGMKWVVRLMEAALRWSVNIMALFFAATYHRHIEESKCRPIYFFLLALLAFVDFTFMIPSLGSRYVMFAYPLIAYIWLVCYSRESKYNWLLLMFSGMYLFYFCLPWNIYQIPCITYYWKLWKADVILQSPIFLFIKYLAGGGV